MHLKRLKLTAAILSTAFFAACSGMQQSSIPNASNSLSASSSASAPQSSASSVTSSTASLDAVANASSETTAASTSKPYEAAVLASHPSAFFLLDDTGWPVTAAAGSNLDGVYGASVSHAGPSLTRDGTASSGFPGGSYNSAKIVSFHPNSALSPASRISVDFWIRLNENAPSSGASILAYGAKTATGNVPYAIGLTPRNTLNFTVNGGAPYYYYGYEESEALSVGKPHHVAATYDGETEIMYVDGRETLSVHAPGPLVNKTNTTGLTLGTAIDDSHPGFAGDLSHVAIYPSVLTSAVVATHYSAGVGAVSTTSDPTPAPAPTAAPVSSPIPSSERETPKTVFSFEDSLGADTHFNYPATPYGPNQSKDSSLLAELPIHHLRDGGTGEDTVMMNLCRDGVHHSLGFPINVTSAQIVQQLNEYDPSCIDYVEPANEYDAQAYSGSTLKIPNWASQLMAEQRVIYTTIKDNPTLSHITVLGPGLASPGRYSALKGIDEISDAASLHDGQCDGSPLTTHYANAQETYDLLKGLYSSTKPVWTTEFAVANSTISGCGSDLKTAAKYVMRQYLVRFNLGMPRNYQNEFSQVPADYGWGVLGMVDQNGNPYPAYTEVKSLIDALPTGQTASVSLASLNYALKGDTANVDHTLLQANDGTYYMILWAEVDSWDVSRKVDLSPAAQAVTLAVPSAVTSASISNPTSSYTMTKTSVAVHGSIALRVTDSPLVVSFKL